MNQNEQEGISLDTLYQGAVVERANLEIQRVLDNIQDPNTDPKKARTVTIKLKFEPDNDRGVANVIVGVDSVVAPVAPFKAHVFLGRDKDGKGFASEFHPPQQTVISETMPVDKVVHLHKEAN